MCFRPSALSQDDSKANSLTCQTCGMPVDSDPSVTGGICPYCGDPIPTDPPDDFSEFDPSYSTRVI